MGKDKKHKRHKSEKKERSDDAAMSRSSSLKLVLKVGGSSTPDREPPPRESPPPVAPLRFSMAAINEAEIYRKEKKHKKKKKKDREKDKHRHKKERRHMDPMSVGSAEDTSRLSSGTEALSQETASSPEPPLSVPSIPPPDQLIDLEPPLRSLSDPQIPSTSAQLSAEPTKQPSPPQQPGTDQKPAVQTLETQLSTAETDLVEQKPFKSSLQRFLEYLLKGLEKKDTQAFFATPVTDSLAPGYSSIITDPMDFSTMRKKIEDGLYTDLATFQEDFRLMCSNAMVYNRMDTIYYKAAKRLLHIGSKMMSPDKLLSLRSVLPYMGELSADVLGFEIEPEVQEPEPMDTSEMARAEASSVPEPVDEEAEAAAILQQAQEAAERAAQQLRQRCRTPPKLGFLRQRADGTTSLAILTPNSGEDREKMEKPVALGVLSGKLSQGTTHLNGFKEDKRNIAKPVKPLYYGAYGSFAPTYDSSFATISREESELLFQTYGDETCQQYAQSVRQFADGCDMAIEMVDNLLDILTDGQHRRTHGLLEQHRRLAEEDRAVSAALAAASTTTASPPAQQADSGVDYSALRSLATLGIDVSFLDTFEAEERRRQEAQSRLDQTSELLDSLNQLQRTRLSQPPEATPAPPSQHEQELADQVTSNLAEMVRQARPGDVAAPAGVRKALGVGPVASTSSPDNPSSHEEVDVEAVSTAATPEVRQVDTPPSTQPGLHELLA